MNKKNTYVAIMAGGIGSRFWPASRTARPKQFLDILGVGKSLIRLTFERFLNLCPAENIFIVTNELYKGLVLEHLPELSENQILCEPSRNNTGPCVAYTAFKLHNLNPDANFIVAPSDHIVLKEDIFVDALEKALNYTGQEDALLTLGIRPSRPDTGYGYINYVQEFVETPHQNDNIGGVHKVIQFTEKPQLAKAKEFVKSGDYLWNAGIFIWRTKSILAAFEKHSNEIYIKSSLKEMRIITQIMNRHLSIKCIQPLLVFQWIMRLWKMRKTSIPFRSILVGQILVLGLLCTLKETAMNKAIYFTPIMFFWMM